MSAPQRDESPALAPGSLRRRIRRACIAALLCLLLHSFARPAGAQQQFASSTNPAPLPSAPATVTSLPDAPLATSSGSVSGRITDTDGAIISGARVRLVLGSQPLTTDPVAVTDSDGRFSFPNVPTGSLRLIVSCAGFSEQQLTHQLQSGEDFDTSDINLTAGTSVEISAISQHDMAEIQIKAEEQQRVLGFIPNFYVSYESRPMPLDPSQKFELAWRSLLDPTTFAFTAAAAGIQQADDDYNGWGQGASGYAKRYAASFGNSFTSTLLGNAVLPIVLKQDPRYFYKGTGSTSSRVFYAIANSVICKGDNGSWQPNYSGIGGSLAAGAISNLYYPAANRQGVSLTFENAGYGIASSAVGNLFQEFVVRKLTPHLNRP